MDRDTMLCYVDRIVRNSTLGKRLISEEETCNPDVISPSEVGELVWDIVSFIEEVQR